MQPHIKLNVTMASSNLADIIKNGEAYISKGSSSYPSMHLKIPAYLDGDNITYVIRAKGGTDVALQMNCSQGSFYSNFGLSDIYCGVQIGTSSIWGIKEMVIGHSSYHEYRIKTSKNTVTVFLDGIAVKTLAYTGKVGIIQDLSIYFGDYGYIDYVSLYDDYNIVFDEGFNVDGSTNAYMYSGSINTGTAPSSMLINEQLQVGTRMGDSPLSLESDPVDTASGAQLMNKTLLTERGAIPLNFSLQYNSLLLNQGVMGKAWSHNFEANMNIVDSSNITVNWGANRKSKYLWDGTRFVISKYVL